MSKLICKDCKYHILTKEAFGQECPYTIYNHIPNDATDCKLKVRENEEWMFYPKYKEVKEDEKA